MYERFRAIAFEAIDAERERQDNKWGKARERHLSDEVWYRILAEEFGEIAHGMNEHDADNVREEIIQTAAVCVAWLESIEEE